MLLDSKRHILMLITSVLTIPDTLMANEKYRWIVHAIYFMHPLVTQSMDTVRDGCFQIDLDGRL
jgi:hypothetical protein